jgi:hypothetical protein
VSGYRIELRDDGFALHRADESAAPAIMLWEDVCRVRTFKLDLGAIDRICLRFEQHRGPALEVLEDWDGFGGLTACMRERFPAIPADWRERVAHPPFVAGETVLLEASPPWCVMQGDAMSPSGRFQIELDEREVFNTCWVGTPTIIDRADGSVVLSFTDTFWSADAAAWNGDRVTLTLRKYPGNHTPSDIQATVDCAARTAAVGGAPPTPIAGLEAALSAALTWQWAPADPLPPPPPPPDPVRSFLRRFFGG